MQSKSSSPICKTILLWEEFNKSAIEKLTSFKKVFKTGFLKYY